MNKAIIGKKLGMTQVFTADGTMIPVTVVQAGPCVVTQVKTVERDGYCAIQLGYGEVNKKRLNKPQTGHFTKSGLEPQKVVKEFKLENTQLKVGDKVLCDEFKPEEYVDITGTTKGHGFSGVIKRWGQHRLKETHGTGPVHREVGSVGANSSPSRVFPGQKMPGQFGVEQVTILNLKVIKVDTERNVLLIKGAIPGPKGSIVTVRNAVKK
ncbi:MAG: 50S ribosomal protein L3 [Clostridia bacterium]|nr:50S ribosomal protein L3 [Clostridia bacterium]